MKASTTRLFKSNYSLGLIALIVCLIFSGNILFAKNEKTEGSEVPLAVEYKRVQKRLFEELDPFANINATLNRSFYNEDYFVPATPDQDEIRAKIEATMNKVTTENRFVQFLDENALIDLPVGLKVDLGVLSYVILIDSLLMTPTETLLYASMSFEAPGMGKIHFLGRDIKFSKTGGIVDQAILELVGDYRINLNGDKSQLIIKGSNHQTFVEFDCNGYKQMSLDASLMFSRDLMIPESANGERIENENVTMDFMVALYDWNDLVVAIDVPKFQLTSVQDLSFEIDNAVLDLSDLQNPAGAAFPEEYASISPYFQSGNNNLWRGVFIREASITLPPMFKKKDDAGNTPEGGNRVSFHGYNMLIDNIGFTGLVTAESLIPIDKGKIGNWNFSLDEIFVDIVANEIKEGGFSGLINIPINKQEQVQPGQDPADNKSLFTYSAVMRANNEFVFNVSNAETLNFDLFKAAEVTLLPSSYIEIKVENKKFLPKAVLNGKMTINASMQSDGNGDPDPSKKDKNVSLADITFQELQVQSVKPYVKVGSFSFGIQGGSGMGGFPLSVDRIYGGGSAESIHLGIELTLALTKSGGGSFAATGGFRINAVAVEDADNLQYKYDGIEISKLGIDIDQGAFAFKGVVNFYKEDPVYGNGVSGYIDASFMDGKIGIQASAIFGTKDDYRYWYVDALAKFSPGLPVFAGVFINRFGGGAYYHMKIDDQGVGSPLGQTVSGMVYVPDKQMGLGLKAMVGIAGGDEKIFNADATFEMAFRASGGLKYINFRGNAYIMTVPIQVSTTDLQSQTKSLASATKQAGGGDINGDSQAAEQVLGSAEEAGERASIYAGIAVNYDFDNKALHAVLNIKINVANGVLTGGGQAVFHFAPNEWYIYIGEPAPEKRFFMEVLGLARFDTYFVMGSVIPDTPPPPPEVASVLKGIDTDYMSELNALADGAGVGFGASFSIDTGDKQFLIFYGRFAAGLGFDVMLKDYGDVSCKGGGTLGVNGWYANGQAYAHFQGEIGLRARVFGKTKSFTILDIKAAVLAQAMLPNPTWVRGVVGGEYNLLGGLISGQCSFEMEIGSKCEMIGPETSVLDDISVLAQITPSEGAREVDVFTVPQAVFNFEMEKEYSMRDEENDRMVTFMIHLEKFSLKRADGVVLDYDMQWNDDKTVAVLDAFEILPSEKEMVVEVITSFKEKKNSVWEVATVEGEEIRETHSFHFTTGIAPDHIPDRNVLYAYPARNMLNYYQEEHGSGYVTLKDGQGELFEESGWTQVARFQQLTGQFEETPASYNAQTKEVQFSLPTNLTNDQIYKLKIVNVPQAGIASIDANVSEVTAAVTVSDDNPEVETNITTREAEGDLQDLEEKELYSLFFRSSKYNTFVAKLSDFNFSPGARAPYFTGVHLLSSNIYPKEPFGKEELGGTESYESLIYSEADLTGNPWFEKRIYPIVYSPLPGGIKIKKRKPIEELGAIPIRAVKFYHDPSGFELTQTDITNERIVLPEVSGRLDYRLVKYMYFDYRDLKEQASKVSYSLRSTSRLKKLLETRFFPVVYKGDYYMNVSYRLPGKNTITSTYRHKIYNKLAP